MKCLPGIHPDMLMGDYLDLDAIGSTRLGWLAVSPRHYQWMLRAGREDTEATALGTALHMAILEPERFAAQYVPEPDLLAIGGAKPRATKAYREAIEAIEAEGATVLREDAARKINTMAQAVTSHPWAQKLLARARGREVTFLWERDGRMCRGRADLLADGMIADIKTTRSLKTFSPHAVTRYGYYRQAGWYQGGLEVLGHKIEHAYYLAVENVPPYDCGVFALEPDAIAAGRLECEDLWERLIECERSNEWPGMFPDLMNATITDAVALPEAAEDSDDE